MKHAANNLSVTLSNITVSYNEEGPENAPVIIFIHGFPLNKSMWDKQMIALKDKYRVIAYDVRGHGDSEAGDGDFSIELFVNDLLGMMDVLKVEKTVLCGLSMGGYIALNAVTKHPDRFDALVLSDTNCLDDTSEAKEKRLKAIDNIRENGVEKFADESIKNLFALESFTTREAEIAAAKEMIVKTSNQSLFSTINALAQRKETCSILPEIKVPVLIMVGEEDKITPPEASKLMHDNIKDSRLSIIENAGHLSNMENPDRFNEQLKQFVASVNP